MAKRSSSVRQRFLAKRGYKKTPRGRQVHHKVPLSKGGSDTLRNLSLVKTKTHKKKHK